MPRLPVVSGSDLAKALVRFGYERLRQKGSHLQLRRTDDDGEHLLTIPLHPELAKGTLNGILKAVASRNRLTRDELVETLKL